MDERAHTTVMPPISAASTRGRHTSGSSLHGERTARGSSGGVGRAPQKDGVPRRFSRRNSKRTGVGKKLAIGLAIVAGIAVAGYGAGVFAFSNIFYPNTQLVGVDVSLMTAATAKGRIESSAVNYKLTLEGEGFSWSYMPEQGVSLADAENRVSAVIAGNDPVRWPVHLMDAMRGEYKPASQGALESLPSDFDEATFDADLSAAVDEFNRGRTGSFDTVSAYDESSGRFTFEKANSNRKLSFDKVALAAKSAVAGLVSKVTVTEHDFDALASDHTDDQIKQACDAANMLIGTNCVLDMAGNEVAKLDGKTLAGFIAFDAELKPSLSSDALTKWTNDFATDINTVGSTRTYTRPDGKTVTIDGGTFGWTVDTAALVSVIQTAVSNKQTDPVNVPTAAKGDTFAKAGEADWKSYVDVDLTEQHVRYYDVDGNLAWESGCVTGKPNGDDDTPTGVWKVNSVSKDGVSTMLRGPKKKLKEGEELKEGESPYEWESPVDVWIPFIGNSYGLHDATWQPASAFSNPDAYKTIGSHGCVNLPLDKAKELRSLLDGKTGTAVIVHW